MPLSEFQIGQCLFVTSFERNVQLLQLEQFLKSHQLKAGYINEIPIMGYKCLFHKHSFKIDVFQEMLTS